MYKGQTPRVDTVGSRDGILLGDMDGDDVGEVGTAVGPPLGVVGVCDGAIEG